MLKGDFSGLAKMRRQLAKIASGQAHQAVLRGVAAEALALVQRGFRDGFDPDGKPWAEISNRIGKLGSRAKPLLDTGRLRSSFTWKLHGSSGFEIGSNVSYAKFHQFGTRGRSRDMSFVRAVTRRGRFMNAKQLGRAAAAARRAGVSITDWDIDEVANASGLSRDEASRLLRSQQRAAARASFVRTRRITFKAGSGKLVARKMLPDGPLSRRWEAAFREASSRAFARFI